MSADPLADVFPGTADAPLPECIVCRLYSGGTCPEGAHSWVPALADPRWVSEGFSIELRR